MYYGKKIEKQKNQKSENNSASFVFMYTVQCIHCGRLKNGKIKIDLKNYLNGERLEHNEFCDNCGEMFECYSIPSQWLGFNKESNLEKVIIVNDYLYMDEITEKQKSQDNYIDTTFEYTTTCPFCNKDIITFLKEFPLKAFIKGETRYHGEWCPSCGMIYQCYTIPFKCIKRK